MPEIKIFDALPEEEILAQMAEECVEASKAALKLRRVRCGVNPTPVSEKDAFENLVEELADIYLCSIVFFGGELDDNDPTPYEAHKNIRKEEQLEAARMRTISALVGALKQVADLAGFEIVGRVVLMDKDSGRIFR